MAIARRDGQGAVAREHQARAEVVAARDRAALREDGARTAQRRGRAVDQFGARDRGAVSYTHLTQPTSALV